MSSTSGETSSKVEVPRKVLHMLVAVLPVLALELGRSASLYATVPLAILAVVADVIRARSPAFERWIQSMFGFMMRPSESVQGRVVLNGATWVLVSFPTLVVIFPFGLAAGAFFMFILADAFAALVGQCIGKRRWPSSRRTLEGSIAFTVIGIAAASIFPEVDIRHALLAVMLGAAAEVPEGPLNDNLRVPVVIAGVMWLLQAVS